MTRLSNRLKLIAGYIEKGQTMADVGTDHGFLPLYLRENDVCPKIVMTDVSEFSLNKAKMAFGKHTGDGEVVFRVGDGLFVLDENEVDVVVISGVGGLLITKILGDDAKKAISFGKYILQPAQGAGKLRYWLHVAGFRIIEEGLAEEGGFIYETIVCAPPMQIGRIPEMDDYREEIEYELPKSSGELFGRLMEKKLHREKGILQMMTDGRAGNAEKIAETEKKIRFLEEKLEEEAAHDAHRRGH